MNELQKYQLLKAHNHAISKGGKCLSHDYENIQSKLEWKCSNEKHNSWLSTYSNIVINGSWCMQCALEASKDQNGLIRAQEYARSKGGKCLANEYKNIRARTQWKCHDPNHPIFEATFRIANSGNWCPQCAYQKISDKKKFKHGLTLAQEYAQSRGGKCLSKEYINSREKLQWKCHDPSHPIWEGSYGGVALRKVWCSKCGNKESGQKHINPNGLKIAQEYAQSRGGKCLSTNYIDSREKLEWKCANEGHKSWFARVNIIRDNNWCPDCAKFFYKEHKIRTLLEHVLGIKLPKSRPKWNINQKTNLPLELDGYNEESKIAFEFQGEQHYKETTFLNAGNLEYTKYKDEVKKQNCLKNNVVLIVIDDVFDLNNNDLIVNYVLKLLQDSNIPIKKEIQKNEIDKIFKNMIHYDKNRILLAHEYAKKRGGECLTKIYINAKNKLKWKCHDPSHSIWESNYMTVVTHGSWCPKCARENHKDKLKNTNGLQIAQDYAKSKGGYCLSTEYVDSREYMKWQCEHNHIWESRYKSIISKKTWCPQCANESKRKPK